MRRSDWKTIIIGNVTCVAVTNRLVAQFLAHTLFSVVLAVKVVFTGSLGQFHTVVASSLEGTTRSLIQQADAPYRTSDTTLHNFYSGERLRIFEHPLFFSSQFVRRRLLMLMHRCRRRRCRRRADPYQNHFHPQNRGENRRIPLPMDLARDPYSSMTS